MIKKFLAKKKNSSGLDVIIHVGSPKTGSSAIQRFCIKNIKSLDKKGFYYPEHNLDKNGVSGGHYQLANLLIQGETSDAHSLFHKMLEAARSRNKTLLLSAEAFYILAEELLPLIKGLSYLVIGWYRHPVEAFVSNYNQAVKRDHSTLRLLEHYERNHFGKHSPHLSGEYLLKWADLHGDSKCNFFLYNGYQVSVNTCIEFDFLSKIGLSKSDISIFKLDCKMVNRSYVPEALELKRLFNLVLDDSDLSLCHRIDWALQQYSDSCKTTDYGAVSLLSPELTREFTECYKISNRTLARRFSGLADLGNNNFESGSFVKDLDQGPVVLTDVLSFLKKKNFNDVELIKQLISKQLAGPERISFSLLKLAELLGVDFIEPPLSAQVITENHINILLNDRASMPDALREITLVLENSGSLDQALLLINRAVELRPNGLYLIKIQERINRKIEMRSKRTGELY